MTDTPKIEIKTFEELTEEQKEQLKKTKFKCMICGKTHTGLFCNHGIGDEEDV